MQSSIRGNASAMIDHAVEVLGRSKQRLSIFRAIYQGKKKVKTVNEIVAMTGLDRVRVLQEGKWLADNELVKQIRLMGATAYEKDSFYSSRRDRIINLVQDPVKRSKVPNANALRQIPAGTIIVQMPEKRVRIRYITIDDIKTFGKIIKTTIRPEDFEKIPEKQFKKGIAKIIGEKGNFTDWGGEQNDLYTDHVLISGKRTLTAFAFKGPGTKGVLTPRKMGKNGDQIQRLFKSAAQAFIIQYWGQIDQSIIEQMEQFAKAKSYTEGETIFYGVIDGDDSNRLIKAYPSAFKK